MVWYKSVSKKMSHCMKIREIHRKFRESKFCFDNAIRNMMKEPQIQCCERSVTGRPGVIKKCFAKSSVFHENDSKMNRKLLLGKEIMKNHQN